MNYSNNLQKKYDKLQAQYFIQVLLSPISRIYNISIINKIFLMILNTPLENHKKKFCFETNFYKIKFFLKIIKYSKKFSDYLNNLNCSRDSEACLIRDKTASIVMLK